MGSHDVREKADSLLQTGRLSSEEGLRNFIQIYYKSCELAASDSCLVIRTRLMKWIDANSQDAKSQDENYVILLRNIERFNTSHGVGFADDFDALIREYGKIVIKECWKVPKYQNLPGGKHDLDELKNDDIRLDCYVDPQLCWVQQNDVRGYFEEKLIELEGPREDQLWKAFETIRSDDNIDEAKNLVLSDGAGAGKTILTRRLAWLITKDAIKPETKEPLMVFRFVNPLPKTDFEKLRDLILAKPSLGLLKTPSGKSLTMKQKERLIDFALKNRRVVVILDGLDEFSKVQKNAFLKLLNCNSGEFTDPVGGDPQNVTTIIAGRQHAIDEHLCDGCFHPNRYKRLKIQPFSNELQDEYFHGKDNSQKNDPARNPLARTGFSKLTWRAVLPENDDTLGELLGLPHTLIQIRQALMNDVEDSSKSEPTRYVSQSDLFLHVSDGLLRHAIKEGKVPDELRIGGKPFDTKLQLAEVLGIVAWRMTLNGYEQAVIPDDRDKTTSEIGKMKDESESRYLLAHPGKKDEFHKAWSLLEAIVLNHRGTTESFEAKSLAFRNWRTQELHVARFLTQHAIQADWDELKREIGDPRWQRILLLAAQMPFKSSHRRLGANKEVYAKTLECIFSRPVDKSQRRPTEVMWRAVEFLKIPRQDDLNDFRADLVRSLKNQLADEFQRIKNGLADWITDPAEIVRAKLIAEGIFRKMPNDPRGVNPPKNESHMVVLADPRKPRKGKEAEDEEKVVDRNGKPMMEFQMGSPQVETDAFDDEKKVYVWLSPFAIHRFPVRNKEFQLFDPAQADEVEDRGAEFLGPDQPAVMVSWYDATVFTWFLGSFTYDDESDQREWRFALPTEAQWEYACRAGTTSLYGVCDQETDLKKYAWYSGNPKTGDQTHEVGLLEPNRWGLYDMLGNVWEWCLDGYDEQLPSGEDPRGPEQAAFRVLRGGSWIYFGRDCRSARRNGITPVSRIEDLGFRLAAVRLQENE